MFAYALSVHSLDFSRACIMNPDSSDCSFNEGARFSKSLSLVKTRSGVTTLKTGSLLVKRSRIWRTHTRDQSLTRSYRGPRSPRCTHPRYTALYGTYSHTYTHAHTWCETKLKTLVCILRMNEDIGTERFSSTRFCIKEPYNCH